MRMYSSLLTFTSLAHDTKHGPTSHRSLNSSYSPPFEHLASTQTTQYTLRISPFAAMTESPMETLKSGDAALSRVQRALGITEAADTTEDKIALRLIEHSSSGTSQQGFMNLIQHEKHDDIHRSSPYPFDQDVVFFAFSSHITTDPQDRPVAIQFGLATLDTKDLERLSLGQEGDKFINKIRKDIIGRPPATAARPLDDTDKKQLKAELAQRFELFKNTAAANLMQLSAGSSSLAMEIRTLAWPLSPSDSISSSSEFSLIQFQGLTDMP